MAALGLTAISDVAALAKLRNDTVWKVLRGDKNRFPTLETAMALGQALSDPAGAIAALENSRKGIMAHEAKALRSSDDEAIIAALPHQTPERKALIRAMIESWTEAK